MTGAPILLLHGIQSGPSTWWRVGPDLETLGFAVAAPTIPGNAGRAIAADASLDSLADDVAPGGPAVVVGHSLGALDALRLAARHPELVTALVLEDPPVPAAVGDMATFVADVAAEAEEARRDPEGLAARLLADNPTWSVRDARGAAANRAAIDELDGAAPLRREPWDLPAMLRAVRCPTTLLLASPDRSFLVGPERAAAAAAADRAIEMASGHSIHRDRPGVWVAVVAEAAGGALPSGPGTPVA